MDVPQLNPYFRKPTKDELIAQFALIQTDLMLTLVCRSAGIRIEEVEEAQKQMFGYVPPRIHNIIPGNFFGFEPTGKVSARVTTSLRLDDEMVERINKVGDDQAAVNAILAEMIGK